MWVNWLSTVQNVSNSTSPTSAIIGSTLNNPNLPPILLILTFSLYLVLMIMFSQSPGRGKFVGICAIVLVISLFESVFGLISTAVLNIIVFVVAFLLSGLFRSN